MPARVHALLFVRADGVTDAHLERTLTAIREQRRPVDALTIVVSGNLRPSTRALIDASGAEGVITTSRAVRFAPAVDLAARRVAADADAVWLLAQDTAPAPDALARLDGALEVQPSLAVAAPKLVQWSDESTIVSLGVTMTRMGRTVGIADGEHDQGQHDADTDVLGADVRGLLVRHDAWQSLGGSTTGFLDEGLRGADEGLDVGVRARLAGYRVSVVPAARVAVAGEGAVGAPAPSDRTRRHRAAYAARTAQLHRRLAYAPTWAVPAHWLSIPLLVVWNSLIALLRKSPGRIVPDAAAAVRVWFGARAVARARRRIRLAGSGRDGSRADWSLLAPLRADRRTMRDRLALDAVGAEPDVRGELRFFSGGGAWTVLVAAVVGIAVFFPLLAASTLGGGGMQPLAATLASIWHDAAYGPRALGWNLIGPADPFAAVIAVLGSTTPWNPSQSLVVLWVLAMPLAALAGWFGATRISDRSAVRIAGAALWAFSPPFIAALFEGRPAAVLVHLLLPWLLMTLFAARRSLAAGAAAALLLAATLACAPSLAPPLGVLVIVALVTAGRGSWRVAGVVLPALALFAPLIWERGVRAGAWISLIADPGVVVAGQSVSPSLAGRLAQLAGSPVPASLGWPAGAAEWAPLLVAPLAALALAGLLSRRMIGSLSLVAIAGLGLVTAFFAAGLRVGVAGDLSVAVWSGAALSLAWAGLCGAALVALDAPSPALVRPLRTGLAVATIAAVVVLAAPGLLAIGRGASPVVAAPRSTLPAYVATVSSGAEHATLVLRPVGGADAAGGVSARVVWGGSETLGGQTTLLSAPGRERGTASGDARFATLVADLVSGSRSPDSPGLAENAIAYVLLQPAASDASEAARSMQARASAALDARGSLEVVGDTPPGRLWKVSGQIAARAAEPATNSAIGIAVTTMQLVVCAIALLLAVPTASSRRAARRYPRVIGASRRTLADQAPREQEPLAVSSGDGDDDDEENAP